MAEVRKKIYGCSYDRIYMPVLFAMEVGWPDRLLRYSFTSSPILEMLGSTVECDMF